MGSIVRLTAIMPVFLIAQMVLGIWPAAAAEVVFTMANYPVEAVGRDAVAAKKKAHAEGQQAALRSLLKRLVPVTAYPRLRRLPELNSADYIDAIAVRSEQNSTTEYIATMDFSFRPKAVKDMLRQRGLPFLEEQSQQITLVPIYLPPENNGAPPPPDYRKVNGTRNWMEIWKGLDLTHALTPVRLRALKKEIRPQVIQSLLRGKGTDYRILTSEYQSQFVVLAVAEPNLGTGRLNVTLVGRDGVNFFLLRRNYRINDDLFFASETAAVIGLGVLEGRWKATMLRSAAGSDIGGGALEPVRFVVTFASASQWRNIRRRIAQTAGVEQMEVGGLSARGATVSLMYPGGAEQLSRGLEREGLFLRRAGGGWLLQGG